MLIKRLVRKSLRDENGSFSVEAIMMFPLLVWAFMGMYVFFEGLRESNINLKATYTIADVLSREEIKIDQTYIDNMNTIYAWLARTDDAPEIRMTVVTYDEETDTHKYFCSLASEGRERMNPEWIPTNVTPHVPIMANDAAAIVVESWVDYRPIMTIGLDQTEIYNIVVTQPRVSGQFACDGMGDGTGSNHDDQLEEDEEGL